MLVTLTALGCGAPGAGSDPAADTVEVEPTRFHPICQIGSSRCVVVELMDTIETCGADASGNAAWGPPVLCLGVCQQTAGESGSSQASCLQCHPDATACENHVLLRCDETGHWQQDDEC